jgi:ketosteroid isomerase-like protein
VSDQTSTTVAVDESGPPRFDLPVGPRAAETNYGEAWIAAFTEGWRAPGGPDAFTERIEPWLDPQIRLVQPQLPTLVGHRAFRERFVRPLFELIPDLHGEVERSAVGEDSTYVEMTLRGTLGGRPIAWRVCDRMTLHEGLVVERETYFDPLLLLRAIATRPRAWREFARQQLRMRLGKSA